MADSLVAVNTVALEENLDYNGEILLHYKIEYPEFKSPRYQMTLAYINRYYAVTAREYQRYIKTELFNMAVEQYKDAIEHGFPVRVFEALQVFEMTYNSACILSLYVDRYTYTGGAHGNTIRSSQTWNMQKGYMIRLGQLFRCRIVPKAYILARVTEQIQENPEIYFEDYPKLIDENFDENSFYCTPDGLVVYYQQYDIAPYSSGIPEFMIPYTGCVIDPARLCFPLA